MRSAVVGAGLGRLAPVLGTLVIRLTFRNLASLVLALVYVVVLGLVSGRLLGITVGRWRSMATALGSSPRMACAKLNSL